MESIFHEKQEGYLCAQHCLNALLQGPYFTPVDLATLGQKMDEEERMRMAESGVDSDDYRRFLEQPSGNMDDSGYFSVQVINSALGVWGLELVPYNSTETRILQAQQNPQSMKAYICNYRDHWFTIRKIGSQWFNLNSLLTGPQLISDTYLAMYLAQLQQEGYSIFVVFGNLPDCQAEHILKLNPVVVVPKSKPVINIDSKDDEDVDLKKAIRLSLGQSVEPNRHDSKSDYDGDLDLAISMSLSQFETTQSSLPLSRSSTSSSFDPDLERALRLSLECTDDPHSSANVDLAEVRRRRLEYLNNCASRNATTSTAKLNT